MTKSDDEGSLKGKGHEIMVPPSGNPFTSDRPEPPRLLDEGHRPQEGDEGEARKWLRGESPAVHFGKAELVVVGIASLITAYLGYAFGMEAWYAASEGLDWLPPLGALMGLLIPLVGYLAFKFRSSLAELLGAGEGEEKEMEAVPGLERGWSVFPLWVRLLRYLGGADWNKGGGSTPIGVAVFLAWTFLSILYWSVYYKVYLQGGGGDVVVHLIAFSAWGAFSLWGIFGIRQSFVKKSERGEAEEVSGSGKKGAPSGGESPSDGGPKRQYHGRSGRRGRG